MKLVRYGACGEEKPGVLDEAGQLRDLSSLCDDIGGATLLPAELARLRAVDRNGLPRVLGEPRLGPCVGGVGKIIGVGLNYADHAAESNMPVPTEPVFFMKPASAI